MQIGFIGLGKMGGNMVQRLMEGGHPVVAYDRNLEVVKELATQGAIPASSVAEMVSKLKAPRIVWVMVPSGNPTEETIHDVASHLQKGDVIIDGGNSMFKDSVRRARNWANTEFTLWIAAPAAAFGD